MTLFEIAFAQGTVTIIVGSIVSLLSVSLICAAGWCTYTRCYRVRLLHNNHDRIADPELGLEETPSKIGASRGNNSFITISNSPSRIQLVTPSLPFKRSPDDQPIRHNVHYRERSQSDPELRIESEVALSIVSPMPWRQKVNRHLARKQQQESPANSNLESTDYDDEDDEETISPLSTPAASCM